MEIRSADDAVRQSHDTDRFAFNVSQAEPTQRQSPIASQDPGAQAGNSAGLEGSQEYDSGNGRIPNRRQAAHGPQSFCTPLKSDGQS